MNLTHALLVCAAAAIAVAASPTASGQSSGTALQQSQKLAIVQSGASRVPKDMPELTAAAMHVARRWRSDALPVSLEYRELNAPNLKGPEVRVRAYSPSTKGGYQVTVRLDGTQTFEFKGTVNWGTLSIPAVFVDLPVVARIAETSGMKSPAGSASLRVYAPTGSPPILAWMIHPGQAGSGRTIDGTTGEIITFDVTGYIAWYNAQWQRAARGLRALLRGPKAVSGGSDFQFGGDVPGSSPSYDDGSAARAEYERNAAESRAYWSGDPDLYNRVKSGQCTWSDASRVGC